LSEAQARVQAATLEVSWKQREADLVNVAEKSRLEVGRVSTNASIVIVQAFSGPL